MRKRIHRGVVIAAALFVCFEIAWLGALYILSFDAVRLPLEHVN